MTKRKTLTTNCSRPPPAKKKKLFLGREKVGVFFLFVFSFGVGGALKQIVVEGLEGAFHVPEQSKSKRGPIP